MNSNEYAKNKKCLSSSESCFPFFFILFLFYLYTTSTHTQISTGRIDHINFQDEKPGRPTIRPRHNLVILSKMFATKKSLIIL